MRLALQRILRCSQSRGSGGGPSLTQPHSGPAAAFSMQENQMKGFILGHSRAEQMCLEPQRFCCEDQSWNSPYCHAYKQGWEAFVEWANQLAVHVEVPFVSHGQIFFFLSTYLTGRRNNWLSQELRSCRRLPVQEREDLTKASLRFYPRIPGSLPALTCQSSNTSCREAEEGNCDRNLAAIVTSFLPAPLTQHTQNQNSEVLRNFNVKL